MGRPLVPTHEQWIASQAAERAARAAEYEATIAGRAERDPLNADQTAADFRAELALHNRVEELASELLDVAAKLGWGSGDPVADAKHWVDRIARARGIRSEFDDAGWTT